MAILTLANFDVIIAAFTDPDTPLNQVSFRKINGSLIDWTVNDPLLVNLADGSVARIYKFGAVNYPELDDTNAIGAPGDGLSVLAGSVTYTLWDGTTEIGPFNMNFQNVGQGTGPGTTALQNTVAPVASGTGTVGQTLSVTDGTWVGEGTISYTYQWLRDGASIGGATSSTYLLVAGDANKTVSCRVTATDDLTSGAADSNGIGVGTIALANTALPNFSGSPIDGQTLTAIPGSWVGQGTINLAYQWLRDGAPISGATSTTYVLVAADVGTTVALREDATDDLTTASATSSGVSVSAAGSRNVTTMRQEVLDEFATSPDKAWQGFTSEAGFTIVNCTSLGAAKTAFDAWANGSPATSKVKIICDWDGLSTASYRWAGVKTAKLSGYTGSTFYGYDIPPGGVWFEAAAGKRPVFGSKLWIDGMTRAHWTNINFAGVRGAGAGAYDESCLRFSRTSSYPLVGCNFFEGCNFGQMDNRPGYVEGDLTTALRFTDGYSLAMKNTRVAGYREGILATVLYRKMEYTDYQQGLGDKCHSFNFVGGYNGRTVYAFTAYTLIRDNVQAATPVQGYATGMHGDIDQLGSPNDTHAGYKTHHEYLMVHSKSKVVASSNTQGIYNDDSPAGTKFEQSVREFVMGIGAFWCLVQYDPSKAGHFWAERGLMLRAGETHPTNNPESYPMINLVQGVPNGGSITLNDLTFTQFPTGSQSPTSQNNLRYCTPVAGKPSGRDGLSQANPKRMEEVISGTVARDGGDHMTYSIVGEDDPDFAVAFYALADFYAPLAGWGTAGVPTDPETWPGAPVRP